MAARAGTCTSYGDPDYWRSLGGQGWAGDASRAEQDYRAYLLWMRPGCHQPWGQYDGYCC